MTTKNENGIAPFLLDPKDPKYKEPKKPLTMKILVKEEKNLAKALKPKREKRFNPVKAYFSYMLEVVLK